MKKSLFGILAVAGLGMASSAQAYNFQIRYVERVGTVDTVIGGDGSSLIVASGSSHRIRIQMGVFDDGISAAPAGGLLGWNVGTLALTGGTNTRTPGRLTPWNFAPNPPGNGLPSADPFTALTAIDATLGTQPLSWGCDPNNPTVPLPMPQAVVRGRNGFSSLFEFTSVAGGSSYDATVGGNQIAALAWNIIQQTMPDCSDPANPPGNVLYAPQADAPRTMAPAVLHFVVPAPGAASLLALGGLIAARRRRA